jgi:hypothetical protein
MNLYSKSETATFGSMAESLTPSYCFCYNAIKYVLSKRNHSLDEKRESTEVHNFCTLENYLKKYPSVESAGEPFKFYLNAIKRCLDRSNLNKNTRKGLLR